MAPVPANNNTSTSSQPVNQSTDSLNTSVIERSKEGYIKKVNQIVKELERQGPKLGDKANAVALISASNLDSNSFLHIESVARNLNKNKALSAKFVEEALLRLKQEREIESIHEAEAEKINNENSEETASIGERPEKRNQALFSSKSKRKFGKKATPQQ